MNDRDARFEPRKIGVERIPGVVVSDGPFRALFALREASREMALDFERRIQILGVRGACFDVLRERDRVGVEERVQGFEKG